MHIYNNIVLDMYNKGKYIYKLPAIRKMLKKHLFQILTFTMLFSCSIKESKDQSSSSEKWDLDELKIGFMHAVIDMPFDSSTEISTGFINPKFKIDLNDDLTFRIENEDESIDQGTFHYTSDSLILKKENQEWLRFQIQEKTDSTLQLLTDGVRFYHIEDDTVHFFTGDNVEMKLKKAGNTVYSK